MADDLHAVLHDDLVVLGSPQLPPCSTARSTITEPGFIAGDRLLRDQHRRRPAGDQRGGDDDVRGLGALVR